MIALLLLACSEPDTTVPDGPPTDTFPSFYGEVPENLLVISIDTLRRDLLVRYGSEQGLIPFLDVKAASGLALDLHRTCSNWTFSSVLCATTGLTNPDLGFVPNLNAGGDNLAPEMESLATRFSSEGWATVLVTSNSWFSADHNSDQGFQVSQRPDDRSTEGVFTEALNHILDAETWADGPWYAQIHIKEPHAAYSPPDAYLEGLEDLEEIPWDLDNSDDQYEAGDEWPEMTAEEQEALLRHLLLRYRGEVAWMNAQLEEQFERLDEAGVLEDTLVVFWTDHGEEFWEHGEQTHAYSLHPEANDAIGIFWAKNIVPASWDEPTSHPDIVASILDLHGLSLEGLSGVPVGQAPPDRTLDFVSVARHGAVQSVVKDGWKLIYRWSTGERQLYDTINDPAELDDVYDPEHPQAVILDAEMAPLTEQLVPLVTAYSPN